MKITVKVYLNDQEVLSKVFSEGSFRACRSEFCDIVLDGDAISRSQLELRVTPTSVCMTNMSGTGRVKLNGERVETAEVKDGDTLFLGPYRFVVFHGERDVEVPAPIQAEEPPPAENLENNDFQFGENN